MDPLTHCLVGGLTAKTLKTSNRRLWIMMFLGEAPDLDVFCSSLGPWAFWLQHRGITHSFVGIVVQTIFYAWLFSMIDTGAFKQRLWEYFIPLFLHVCCDYLTSYGIPLFSPFTYEELAGNLVPAVTVIPLVFMLVGIIWLHRKKRDGWQHTRALWGMWVLYLLFSMGGRAYAGSMAGGPQGKYTMVAGLANPFRWTAVVHEDWCCNYDSYSINIISKNKRQGPVVRTDIESLPIKASLASPRTRQLVESIRWPVARIAQIPDGGWRVDWGKVIFSSRGFVRGMWSVDIDKDGKVKDEKRTYEFWDVD